MTRNLRSAPDLGSARSAGDPATPSRSGSLAPRCAPRPPPHKEMGDAARLDAGSGFVDERASDESPDGSTFTAGCTRRTSAWRRRPSKGSAVALAASPRGPPRLRLESLSICCPQTAAREANGPALQERSVPLPGFESAPAATSRSERHAPRPLCAGCRTPGANSPNAPSRLVAGHQHLDLQEPTAAARNAASCPRVIVR